MFLVLRTTLIFDPSKIVSEYDQEIPQSQTSDKAKAPRGRATQQSRDTSARNYNASLKLRKTKAKY